MSWGSGSLLMAGIIERIESIKGDDVPSELLKVCLYGILIDEFENQDCDTLYELADEPGACIAFKTAFEALHPPEEDD